MRWFVSLQATDVNEFTTDGHVLTYDRDTDTTSVYSLVND